MRPSLAALAGPRVHELLRLVLLVLCGAVAGSHGTASQIAWLVPLGVLGILSSHEGRGGWAAAVVVAVEAVAVGVAVAATGAGESPYLPYVIAPAFTGGFAAGVVGSSVPVLSGTGAFFASSALVEHGPSPGHLSSSLAQWGVLAAVVGVVAAWVRAVLLEADQGPDVLAAQVEAFRLLTELRTLARQLPGTLDPGTTAETMLDRARTLCRYDVGAVLVSLSGSKQVTFVSLRGSDRPNWDLSLEADGPIVESWLDQRGRVLACRLPRTDGPAQAGSSLVVPLLSGGRTFGLVVLESGVAQAFPPDTAEKVGQAMGGLAIQLQTGMVFDEVRELATHEERRRLAREIHDGIAQELASLAYSLDNVAADVRAGSDVVDQVDTVRDEVRRLVTELRMSLFDLRSDVDPDEGLGAAIGRYVRAVATASAMTVHLSLNEAPVRLGAETEAELLRIVQEAVTNARKHASAGNLWVTCTVDPPSAFISVEDDGRGMSGDARSNSHGLAIMRERAGRIRAEMSVLSRQPHGTRIEVSLGRVRS